MNLKIDEERKEMESMNRASEVWSKAQGLIYG